MIVKRGSRYALISKRTGKTLGTGTKAQMQRREQQINYFKHKRGG